MPLSLSFNNGTISPNMTKVFATPESTGQIRLSTYCGLTDQRSCCTSPLAVARLSRSSAKGVCSPHQVMRPARGGLCCAEAVVALPTEWMLDLAWYRRSLTLATRTIRACWCPLERPRPFSGETGRLDRREPAAQVRACVSGRGHADGAIRLRASRGIGW